MKFAMVDMNNVVTGIYDGSNDYVHRVTGEAQPNAKQIPMGCLPTPLTDMCFAAIDSIQPGQILVYNPDTECLEAQDPTMMKDKQERLKAIKIPETVAAEEARIEGLTEAELDTELGV